MPQLPDLPPLPESYPTTSGLTGPYIGVVGGLSLGNSGRGTVGIVAGTALVGDTVVVGLEAMGLIEEGSSSLEAGLRLGYALTDAVSIFSQASIGADRIDGAFLGLGSTVEWTSTDALTWRGQYRHAFDLSGDEGKDLIMIGAVFNF